MSKKKTIIASLIAGLSLCALAGCATANADVDIRDYFNIPNEVQTNAYVGAEMTLASVTATDSEAENFKFALLDANGKEVATDGYKFTPAKAGEYKCVYSYTLGGEKYEYSYKLNVTVKDGPVFSDDVVMPYALMAKREYTLPVLTARDYLANADAQVTVTATCAGEAVAIEDYKFTPVYKGVGTEAEIVYTATVGGKTETLTTKVPVLNPFESSTETDFTQLFLTSGFESAERLEDSIVYSTINDSEAKFANYMHQDGIDFMFGFGESYKAESITIKLESVEDPSVYTTLTFEKGKAQEGTGYIILNGKDKKEYKYTALQQLRFAYNSANKYFEGVGGELLFNLKTDANGNAFNGFPGKMVKVSFSLGGVYGDASLAFYTINNLTIMGDVVKDTLPPQLFFPSMNLEFLVGETVSINGVSAVDVVDPNVRVTVSVTVGGQAVRDINGVALTNVNGTQPISFVPEKPGDYLLKYTMIDGSGNRNVLPIQRQIYVYDRNAPTIEVKGSIPSTAVVGQKVTLPEIKADDLESGRKTELQIIVRWPSAKMRQIGYSKNGNLKDVQFTFDKKGTYTIMLVAMDESGNYTRNEYKVVCS